MATEITRGAPPAVTEEARAADATVDSEEVGGTAGYVMAAPGAVIPISVLEPGSGFEPTEDAAPTPAAADEETAPAP